MLSKFIKSYLLHISTLYRETYDHAVWWMAVHSERHKRTIRRDHCSFRARSPRHIANYGPHAKKISTIRANSPLAVENEKSAHPRPFIFFDLRIVRATLLFGSGERLIKLVFSFVEIWPIDTRAPVYCFGEFFFSRLQDPVCLLFGFWLRPEK